MARSTLSIAIIFSLLSLRVAAQSMLTSSGFTNCLSNATIKVDRAAIQFDKTSGNITFDVQGTSSQIQKVVATLVVTAYGNTVASQSFNPCDASSFVAQLCPGKF
jgi:hypothetical protein